MKHSILFLFSAFLLITGVFAQNTPQPNDLDNLYTPPAGSVFNNKDIRSVSTGYNNSMTQSKNIILFNLALVLRSSVYLTYERAINESFSVIGGLGTYLGRDLFEFITSELGDEFGTDAGATSDYNRIWSPDYTDFSSGGIQFGFAGRLFFDDDFENRSYLEVGARFYHWYFKSKGATGNSSVYLKSGTDYAIYNQQVFINYGTQFTTGDKIKFAHELYYGIGMRFYSCDELTETKIVKNYDTFYEYQPTGSRHHIKRVSLLFGYKLGVGW